MVLTRGPDRDWNQATLQQADKAGRMHYVSSAMPALLPEFQPSREKQSGGAPMTEYFNGKKPAERRSE